MTTTYAILLHGDEAQWAVASPDERARLFGLHDEFTRLLAERGHTVVGGAELSPAATATVVRGTRDGVTVTDGPYAEAVGQLGGFCLVTTDHLEDLVQLCGVISDGEPVEVRACLESDDPPRAG